MGSSCPDRSDRFSGWSSGRAQESTFCKIVPQGGPAQRPIFRIFTLVLVPRAALVAPFSSPQPWIQVSSGRCFYTDDPPPPSARPSTDPHTPAQTHRGRRTGACIGVQREVGGIRARCSIRDGVPVHENCRKRATSLGIIATDTGHRR